MPSVPPLIVALPWLVGVVALLVALAVLLTVRADLLRRLRPEAKPSLDPAEQIDTAAQAGSDPRPEPPVRAEATSAEEVLALRARVHELSQTISAFADPTALGRHLVPVEATDSSEAEVDESRLPAVPTPSGVPVGGSDLVTLSHSLAAAGRVHEAALAQWAADLQLLRPHLGARAADLCAALESLSPLDAQSAVAGARTAVASLVDRDLPVLSLLGPTAHLAGPDALSGPAPARDDEPSGLPTHLELALESALTRSAEDGGDVRGVSVALRRNLLRHRAARAGATDDPSELMLGVLEPHEQDTIDDDHLGATS